MNLLNFLGGKYTRGVILAGLPFPCFTDPRVKLKRSYLDKASFDNYNGGLWYNLQMSRALNQSIGRAIRHKDDYGCVFLLDERFRNHIEGLSLWCQAFVKVNHGNITAYQDIMNQTQEFFKNKLQTGKTDNVLKAENNWNDDLMEEAIENISRKRKAEQSSDDKNSNGSIKDKNKCAKKPHLQIEYDEGLSDIGYSSSLERLLLIPDEDIANSITI